jgi:hypothetical protein
VIHRNERDLCFRENTNGLEGNNKRIRTATARISIQDVAMD